MKLAPTHLKRYKDVALLFYKYGGSDMMSSAGFDPADSSLAQNPDHTGEDLAKDLEALGPTFIKIGQLLSTRSDLLPQSYLDALVRLQDKVEPVPYEEIEKFVQQQLGVRISKAFSSFETRPVGSASLGQVHVATLRNGQTVAVKVQRPDIREQILSDLDSLAEMAEFVDAHTDFGRRYEVARIVEHFRGTLIQELDYLKEAHHLTEFRHNLAEFPRLIIPRVIEDYSTSQVITMDYVSGTKITALSGAVLVDLDGDVLAEQLFRAYLKQILVDGFFHADPHPGNLLLTLEHRIAILDLGMVGRLNQRMRDQLVHLLAGIADGDGVQTAEAALKIGELREHDFDRSAFISAIEDIVASAKTKSMSEIQVGAVVLLVLQVCARYGVRIPAELNLLGKSLMNLDKVGVTLSPTFNPNEFIRDHLHEITRDRVKENLTISNVLGALSEMKDFLGQFPARMNRILEMMADNKLRMRVDTIDEHKLIQGLQKVANRITTGLVIAALIIGSALLTRVETSYRLFGYPGLAMILFLVAFVAATGLMIQIFFKDE